MVEENVFIATVLTFVAGFFLALLVEKKRKHDARVAAARSIIIELEEIQTALNGHVKTDDQIETMRAEIITGHFNAPLFHLQTAAYESAIFSGVFRDFHKETQKAIAVVYDEIRYANMLESKSLDYGVVPVAVTPAFYTSLGMLITAINNYERHLQMAVARLIEHLRGLFLSA